MQAETPTSRNKHDFYFAIGLALLAAIAFYFSTKPTLRALDYIAEIASALLRGDLGLREKPPEWLNEMIPYGDRYYSAFPLGAVISMVPVALLQKASLVRDFPARVLATLIAGACVYFFFRLTKAFGPDYVSFKTKPLTRRILLALFPIFGTWAWCNLGMGGAWQIALGLALLGETAALYFMLVRPSPFIAGAFFALAFGNRTELLLTPPFYLYLFWRRSRETDQETAVSSPPQVHNRTSRINRILESKFYLLPLVLLMLCRAWNINFVVCAPSEVVLR